MQWVIQCDERRPICSQCERAGRICTKALTRFVFESDIQRGGNVARLRQTCKPHPGFIRWKPIVGTKSGSHGMSEIPEYRSAIFIRSPSNSRSDSLAAKIVNMIQSTARTERDILVLGEFLPALPARIGSNAALDASAHAFLLFYGCRIHGEKRDQSTYTTAYTRALQELKLAISAEQSLASAETVCAALALATVEILRADDFLHVGWASHTRGRLRLDVYYVL
jgi:hypothetical protein